MLDMIRPHARSRLCLGLVLLLNTVLMLALCCGIVPDYRIATMEGRVKLCESLALSGSAFIQDSRTDYFEEVLKQVAARNPDILSVAVRRDDGEMIVALADHELHWEPNKSTTTDQQMEVPIFEGNAKWGTAEFRFVPLRQPGLWGYLTHPWTRLLLFVGGMTYFVYQLYLGRVLKQLNPSNAVPQRVRNALNTLAGGLVVIDAEENIALANQAFSDAIGISPEDLVSTSMSAFHWDTRRGSSEMPWTQVLQDGQSRPAASIILQDDDQVTRTFMVNCSAVFGRDDDEVRGVLISLDDITPLERTKAQLAASKMAAEEANHAKSEFLARMSHEIRTPMNAIIGFADALRRGFEKDEDEREQYLIIIHSSGQHLIDLINDILDLSKVESGQMKAEKIDVSPVQAVVDVVSVLRGHAEEKNIFLEYDFEGLVPKTIKTDPIRLRQILTNLINNAVKFTSKGGVTVRGKLDAENEQMEFQVVDTGIGVPPNKLKTIFDPFSQADTSVTRRFGGTGLGLAICQRLSETLGGEISVQSAAGKGSVFTVSIATGPLNDIKLVEAEEAVVTKQVQGVALTELPDDTLILVADDGETNRRLIKLVLERVGAEVHEVKDGQEAINTALEYPYDLILMDLQMPVIDGLTATRKLRAAGFDKPIVALTADAMKGTEKQCMHAGCTGYLTKPINMDEVVATIASIVGASDQPSEPDLAPANAPAERASTPQSSTASDTGKIYSNLPMDDEEFRQIAKDFVKRLREKAAEMTKVWRERDLEALAGLAHWLKGSGGMAGFAEFIEPAVRLEELARTGDNKAIAAQLREIIQLVARVDVCQEDLQTA